MSAISSYMSTADARSSRLRDVPRQRTGRRVKGQPFADGGHSSECREIAPPMAASSERSQVEIGPPISGRIPPLNRSPDLTLQLSEFPGPNTASIRAFASAAKPLIERLSAG